MEYHPRSGGMEYNPMMQGGAQGASVVMPPTEEYRDVQTVLTDAGSGRDHTGVSAIVFDHQQELLWSGNQGGHVTSYFGPSLQKYTSFQVHHSNDIRQLLSIDAGMLILTKDYLRCQSRKGLRMFSYNSEAMVDMQCMILNHNDLLFGGHQAKMIEIDLVTGAEKRQVDIGDNGVAIMRHSNHFLCCGDTSGRVTIRDPVTLKSQHVFEAHNGTLSDIDVNGNMMVTCGFSKRLGTMLCDRFVMVYDLRAMRSMAPYQLPLEPMFLRFIPTYTQKLLVLSQMGQFQLCDPRGLVTQSSLTINQINMLAGHYSLSMDVSSTHQGIAIGDTAGYLHLWTDTNDMIFNAYSRPTQFADPIEHLPYISVNDPLTPYSSIPMPYCDQPLLSDWPQELMNVVYRKSPPIDQNLRSTMKHLHFIGTAPNPGNKHRNQVPYNLKKNDTDNQQVAESVAEKDTPVFNPLIKKYNRPVELTYSKWGLEDFDFRYYNKTNFAGLENELANTYCNVMIQMLYFIEPLQAAVRSHLCKKEFCLSCELSSLFHMLHEAKRGDTCQANNFLRSFRTIQEVSALGLLLADDVPRIRINYQRLLQSFNRFILQQLDQEIRKDSSKGNSSASGNGGGDDGIAEDSIVSRLFGCVVDSYSQCKCSKQVKRTSTNFVFSMSYPELLGEGKLAKQYTFSEVLQRSMSSEQTTQAWCDECGKYQPTEQWKTLQSLPDIISINCQLENENDLVFWRMQQRITADPSIKSTPYSTSSGHLPPREGKVCRYGNQCNRPSCKFWHERDENILPKLGEMIDGAGTAEPWAPLSICVKLLEDGTVSCSEGSSSEKNTTIYDLTAAVCHVRDMVGNCNNTVGHIFIGPSYHKKKEGVSCTGWYSFNDFCITPIETDEANKFDVEWLVPCVMCYTKRGISDHYDTLVHNPIDMAVFLYDTSLTMTSSRSEITFKPLDETEIPQPKDLVGLDAEFVTLNQQETEIRSDGSHLTVKPSQLSVARITCVRGQGELEMVPFIDDYISTPEQVVDYLTKFSGIKPGDLDLNISSKHLTTLKSTYLKLRYLIDQGVIFVGHGLKKDFRVINLLVPKDQVIDTVFLFRLTKQRMISLKFLAWYFLSINIQGDTHDSIEDARTALRLYRKYLDITHNGFDQEKWKAALKELYEEGRKLNWKVPGTEE